MHNYGGNPGVGGFMDVVKKIRKVVHSIAPRELSPSRMLEKYQSDQAKKVKAKLASNSAKQAAELNKIKADSLAQIKADAAVPVQSSGLVPVATNAPTDNSPIYMAAAVGGLLLILLAAKGKKK